MSSPLPPPINGTEEYLAAIHRRLGDILDRLPEPANVETQTVELREPEPNVDPEKATAGARARGGAKSAGGKGRGRPQATTRSTSKPREG